MANQQIKIILMGTPEFAAEIFDEFVKAPLLYSIVSVITSPDKPIGRKQELTASPVKVWAEKNNLSILQPEKIADAECVKKIQDLKPDVIIVAAYGQIIPKEILDIPQYSALNIHPSLLPKYRGASPIHAAILNGDKKTGVTIMLMDEKMDHGAIISNSEFLISNKISFDELSKKLADLGAKLLIKTLPDYLYGKIKPKSQDHSKAIFTKIIKKEDGKIDWHKSAEKIERRIRAFKEWPTAYAEIPNKFKIINADIINKKTDHKIGEVFLGENKSLNIKTGDGILILKEVQLEGKRQMTAKDFLNGHPEIIGTILK